MKSLAFRSLEFCLVCSLLLSHALEAASSGSSRLNDTQFEQLSIRLSEPGGYFGTDNLVSNESSFLHVDDLLRVVATPGQAYLGVGPSQNFTYIAKVRPSLAFILDIRRNNMLYHLYFKALFLMAENRCEFLSMLFAKPLRAEESCPLQATSRELFQMLQPRQMDEDASAETIKATSDLLVSKFPHLLNESDRVRIHHMAEKFARDGFGIRYEIPGRPMLTFFPSYGDLMLETDLHSRLDHYLNTEEEFQYVKRMQEENRIIPVVGNFGGRKAVVAIGEEIRTRGLTLSLFYISNVEFYLLRSRLFRQFVENVRSLPIDARSLLVRSYFNNWFGTWRAHPDAVPGYFSTSLAQPVYRFIELDRRAPFENYWDLVTRDYIQLPADPELMGEPVSPPD